MMNKHFRLTLATLTAVVLSVGCATSYDKLAYEKVQSMRGTDVSGNATTAESDYEKLVILR